jgi:hypothetical protein
MVGEGWVINVCQSVGIIYLFGNYVGYPRNMLENDGRKLSKHLRNRGRPTEMTWKKYQESKAAKKLKGWYKCTGICSSSSSGAGCT